MTLKRIHRFFLLVLMLLPFIILVFYMFNRAGNLTSISDTFTDFTTMLNTNFAIPSFLQNLTNFFTNALNLGIGYQYVIYLLVYELLVLFLDLCFGVVRWFIMLISKIFNKWVE